MTAFLLCAYYRYKNKKEFPVWSTYESKRHIIEKKVLPPPIHSIVEIECESKEMLYNDVITRVRDKAKESYSTCQFGSVPKIDGILGHQIQRNEIAFCTKLKTSEYTWWGEAHEYELDSILVLDVLSHQEVTSTWSDIEIAEARIEFPCTSGRLNGGNLTDTENSFVGDWLGRCVELVNALKKQKSRPADDRANFTAKTDERLRFRDTMVFVLKQYYAGKGDKNNIAPKIDPKDIPSKIVGIVNRLSKYPLELSEYEGAGDSSPIELDSELFRDIAIFVLRVGFTIQYGPILSLVRSIAGQHDGCYVISSGRARQIPKEMYKKYGQFLKPQSIASSLKPKCKTSVKKSVKKKTPK